MISQPPAPLSIVHVLRAPVGGLFRHVVDLSREQAARGCRVGIIADSLTGGPRADEVLGGLGTSLALGVHRLAMPRNPAPGDALNILKISRLLKDLSPDVVHGHGSKGGLYARAPGLAGGGPIRAYTPHGGSFHYASGVSGAVYMGMERLLARATDLFLFESAYIRRQFEQKIDAPEERKFVTLNGISDAEFAPVAPAADAADFLYIGELRALKGIDTLLHAMAAPNAPSWTLNVVGAGPDEALLRERAISLGLAGRVTFLGAMPAREAFARARAIVVPSRAESLPYVVIEAAAARMPIVATNVGGIPEILTPAAGDLIMPDDPAALADAMLRIKSLQPEQSEARARLIEAHVRERFTIAAMTTSILNACGKAVEARRAQARQA
ncbi:MAG: glycosyltransferase family 4 protein [Beijerinckiaceae bacterium]